MNTHEYNFGKRLETLIKRKGLSVDQFAEAVGVSNVAAYKWVNNASRPRQKTMEKILSVLDVSEQELRFGDEDKAEAIPESSGIFSYQDISELDDNNFIVIPEYNIKLSAGNGNGSTFEWVVRDKEEGLPFRARWFKAKGIAPENCRALMVKGDSMSPKLDNGDTVVIDVTDTEIIDGNIYAILFKNAYYIKSLIRGLDTITIHSFNEKYLDISVSEQEYQDLTILGRMVNRSGSGGQ